MKQLGGQDASFLYLESDNAHLHLTALYVYEQAPGQPLDFDAVYRHVSARLHTADIFRQRIVRPALDMDYPYWVDDDAFDLAQHVHRFRGSPPRSRGELYDLVAQLHSEPLDLSRPPWEMHVIEKPGPLEGLPKNCFVVIAKYHHAAIDGASGAQLVDGLHDLSPSQIQRESDEDWIPRRAPGKADVVLNAVVNNIRGPYRVARALAGSIPSMIRSALAPAEKKDEASVKVPKTRFNRRVGSRRVFHSMSVDLDTIRSIRKAVDGATVNDVMLAICGGGLRQWLHSLNELPEESLVAMVPVNARSDDEKSLGGNKLATLFIPIHTDLPDPLERLGAIQEATRRAKSDDTGLDAREMGRLSNQIPAITLSATGQLITGLGLGYRAMNLCNCTITNVPGPRGTLYLGPARLAFNTGSAPIIDGMGLLISAFSYGGQVTFSFTSCPEMLPDPERLAECTYEAYEELAQQAL